MKLNRQFQDQHMEQQSANWVLKQQLERDICLLYHQLANYSYIMGDLYYGDVFGLAYWDHLQLPAIDDADRDFIRDGCLVMILAMASECIDGTGSYLRPHVPQCRAKLERLSTADSDADKLIGIVRRALDIVEHEAPEPPDFSEACVWVHKRYVRGYFIQQADDFRNNAYFAS